MFPLRSRRKSSLHSLLVLNVITLAFSALAAEYEVSGTLYQTFGTRHASASFTVYVKDCNWLIATTETNELGRVISREIGSTNENEIYECVFPSKATPPKGIAKTHASTVATILATNIPVGPLDDAVVGHLWLMFASQCYWTNLKTNWLTPVYDWQASILTPSNRSPNVRAEWNLFAGPGSLPREVKYFTDTGQVNDFYLAKGSNSAGGTMIPDGFVLEQHSIEPFRGIFLSEKRVDVEVTTVSPVCSRSDFLPSPPAKALVIDRRVDGGAPTNRPPSYQIPVSGKWATLEDARRLVDTRRRAAALLNGPKGQVQKPLHRTIALIALVCIPMLGPLVIYFFSKRFGKLTGKS